MSESQSKLPYNYENKQPIVLPDCHDRFESAQKLQDERKNIGKISTGSRLLNRMLFGGIETSALTEFYGGSGTGKTQLCFTLCAIVQQDISSGGLNGNAIYIDTEQKFVPNRIVQIAYGRGFELNKILSNILVSRPLTFFELEKAIQNLNQMICKHRIKLILVDSIISPYRSEFEGRAALPERQHRLYKSMRILANIARAYNIAVVVTNQVQSLPDSPLIESSIPTGGNVMAHASTLRIKLSRVGQSRLAKLVTSPCCQESSEKFIIAERGISDED